MLIAQNAIEPILQKDVSNVVLEPFLLSLSRGKWSNLRQPLKKFEGIFKVTSFLHFWDSSNFKIVFYIFRTNPWKKKNIIFLIWRTGADQEKKSNNILIVMTVVFVFGIFFFYFFFFNISRGNPWNKKSWNFSFDRVTRDSQWIFSWYF